MTPKNQEQDAEALKLRQFEEQAIPLMPRLMPWALEKAKNDRIEAEDLMQEAFGKAYRYWHTFEQGTNLYGWLKMIIENTSKNRNQKEFKHKVVAELDAIPDWKITEDDRSLTARTNRSAEAEALANLASDDVQDALENLKPEFQAVVQMAIVDGYSYKEIADILDIKIGTVMSRLHRGKKYLREALYTYAEQEGYDVSAAAKEAVIKETKKGKKK